MRGPMRIKLVAALVLFISASAHAQSGDPSQNVMMAYTGNQFLNLCDSTADNINIQRNLPSCRIFLNGFIQGMFNAKWDYAGTEAKAVKCSPNVDSVTNQQLLDVVLKFLRDHPAVRDISVGILVFKAINEVWPDACSQKGTNPDSDKKKR